MYLSVAEVEHIAITAAKAAVNETLKLLGVDVDDPLSMQQDMAHLRSWRKIFEGVVGKVIAASMIGFLIVGILFLVAKLQFH